jgi:hypothetical protein
MALPTHLILRSAPQERISKDRQQGRYLFPSFEETPRAARLLRMRTGAL